MAPTQQKNTNTVCCISQIDPWLQQGYYSSLKNKIKTTYGTKLSQIEIKKKHWKTKYEK